MLVPPVCHAREIRCTSPHVGAKTHERYTILVLLLHHLASGLMMTDHESSLGVQPFSTAYTASSTMHTADLYVCVCHKDEHSISESISNWHSNCERACVIIGIPLWNADSALLPCPQSCFSFLLVCHPVLGLISSCGCWVALWCWWC